MLKLIFLMSILVNLINADSYTKSSWTEYINSIYKPVGYTIKYGNEFKLSSKYVGSYGTAQKDNKIKITIFVLRHVNTNNEYIIERKYNLIDKKTESTIFNYSLSLSSRTPPVINKNEILKLYKEDQEATYTGTNDYRNIGIGLTSIYLDGICKLTLNDYCSAVSAVNGYFQIKGWTTAQDTLSHFFYGNNKDYKIDIMSVLNNNTNLKRTFFQDIYSKYREGYTNGIFEIQQNVEGNNNSSNAWEIIDYSYAYGTLPIHWETNGNIITFYVENIYSYHLNKVQYTKRKTFNLYKSIGKKVIDKIYHGDFYITNNKIKYPLDLIRIEAGY